MDTKSALKRTPFSIDAILTNTKSTTNEDCNVLPLTTLPDGFFTHYQNDNRRQAFLQNTHILSNSFLSHNVTENSLNVLEHLSRQSLLPHRPTEQRIPTSGFMPLSPADKRSFHGYLPRTHGGREFHDELPTDLPFHARTTDTCGDEEIDVTTSSPGSPCDPAESDYSCDGEIDGETDDEIPEDQRDLSSSNSGSFTNAGLYINII